MAKLFVVPGGEKYPDTYDRKLSDDFRSITSTCGLCGEVLKGSRKRWSAAAGSRTLPDVPEESSLFFRAAVLDFSLVAQLS